jgi:hypothetical protein
MPDDMQGWQKMVEFIKQDLDKVETNINNRIDRLEDNVKEEIKDFHDEFMEHATSEERKFTLIHERVSNVEQKLVKETTKVRTAAVLFGKIIAIAVALGTLVLAFLRFHFL